MLRKMSNESFDRLKVETIHGFAGSCVKTGRWSEEEALQLASTQFEQVAPDGLLTPNHYFMDVLCPDSGAVVGYIWWKIIQNESGRREAFILALRVFEQFRRGGHSKRAVVELESMAQELCLDRITGNIFTHNRAVREVARSLGYSVTGNGASSLCVFKDVG